MSQDALQPRRTYSYFTIPTQPIGALQSNACVTQVSCPYDHSILIGIAKE